MGIFGTILEFLNVSEHVVEKTAFLKELVIIFLAIKVIGHISKKFGQPSVFGKLLVGIILGPSILGILHTNEVLKELAEVGVIMLMFLAGLETDVDEFKKSAVGSSLAAIGGVVLPLIAGWGMAVYYGYSWEKALFVGTILVATSVSISVQTLRELGKLQTPEGFTILGAAVIDDVLGLIVLSVVIGIALGGGASLTGLLILFAKIAIFFVAGGFIGKIFFPKVLEFGSRVLVSEGVLTFAFILALSYAIGAEYFGMAGIVGAYLAGIMMSMTKFQHQLFEKVETVGYSFFVPIFFINIGLSADARGLTGNMLGFTVIITILAILTKIIGAGLGAKLTGFNMKSSLGIGVGMVSRGEVALIVASIGLGSGLIGQEIFTSMVVMAIITTVVTPPLLKIVFKD
ncbi:MAG: cation:proton antiporter [Bacillota bacterium]